MKRFFFVLILVGAVGTLSAAQYYMGFMGGYDFNTFTTKTNYAYDLRYSGRGGLTIGMPTQLCITDWFAMRFDLMYVQKNHKNYRTHAFSDIYTNVTNHYLQMPIMLNFSFGGERFRGYMSAGGYIGCWLISHREGKTLAVSNNNDGEQTIYAFDERRPLDNAHDRRFDSGLAGNIGIAIHIDQRMIFHIEAGCYYSLLSLERDKNFVSPTPSYNTTFNIQCGLTFSVNQKRKSNHRR